ncbi:hypothetical protein C0J52_08680 [Blattella germanica]|nr:hypothetical protein C0J52_08680 [Blattella germanica]
MVSSILIPKADNPSCLRSKNLSAKNSGIDNLNRKKKLPVKKEDDRIIRNKLYITTQNFSSHICFPIIATSMLLQFLSLLCFCIFIHSNYATTKTGVKTSSPHEFHQHNYKACKQRNFSMAYAQTMKDSMCMSPRETVVQLNTGDSEILYIPSAVLVKRCSGMCGGNLACVPVETREVRIGVRKHKVGESVSTCGEVVIEEHVRCKCKCEVMPSDCNEHQKYTGSGCMCSCMNMKEKERCENEAKLWDQKQCKCNCRTEEKCSTGLTWVPEYCKCMRVMQ